MTSSIAPEVWGPPFWAAIHLTCLAAPKSFDSTTEVGYRQFFTSLQHVLPCKKCREHLAANLASLPLDGAFARGRESLFEWSVHLHNRVNAANGKPEMPVADARKLWMAVANGKIAFMELEDLTGAPDSTGVSIKKKVFPRWVIFVIAFAIGALVSYYATRPPSGTRRRGNGA